MKKSALFPIIIIVLLSWCSGCSNRAFSQSGIEAKIVNPPALNTNDLEAKTNHDGNDEEKVYRSILSGWKYIMMDFNKDGSNELFIQLIPDHDSALFSYKDGNIKCIYIDDVEINCFTQPLKDGRLLETYNHWIAPTKTIFEFDSEFNQVNKKRYLSITVDDYEYYKENYGEIINQYPIITKEGVYFFQDIDGEITELSKVDWEKIQKDIDEQIVPDSEWKNCSDTMDAQKALKIKV